jgi:hypothetical protein
MKARIYISAPLYGTSNLRYFITFTSEINGDLVKRDSRNRYEQHLRRPSLLLHGSSHVSSFKYFPVHKSTIYLCESFVGKPFQVKINFPGIKLYSNAANISSVQALKVGSDSSNSVVLHRPSVAPTSIINKY